MMRPIELQPMPVQDEPMPSEDKIIKLRVSADAADVISRTAERLGMTSIAVAGRLVQWFAEQDDATQKGVLGLWPEGHEADLLRLVLSKRKKP